MQRFIRNASRGARASAFGIALAAIALVPLSAGASVDGDVRGGYYADSELGYFGGGLLSSMGHSNWYFNPNLEIAPSDGPDLFSVNGDFHYDFANSSNTSFWAGGGPAVLIVDRNVPGDDTDTDLGMNVLMGLGARSGEVRPFGQLKGVLADNSQLVLTGGIRF